MHAALRAKSRFFVFRAALYLRERQKDTDDRFVLRNLDDAELVRRHTNVCKHSLRPARLRQSDAL